MKIILLEDDQIQADLLIRWLTEDGHDVEHFTHCKSLLMQYHRFLPDMILLDWELPDGNGLALMTELREEKHCVAPILFITARVCETDIVAALEAGADDYLSKPLRKAELKARILALGRRSGLHHSACVRVGSIRLDRGGEQIFVDNIPVKLTRKEYMVARCLLENVGKVLSRQYLLKTVWGIAADIDTRTVDVHVSRVRRALTISPAMGYIVKNIYQHGYRLEKI